MFGGGDEVAHQLAGDRFAVRQLGARSFDGVRHVQQPPVALERSDMKGEVTHPQSRMPTLLHVRRGSTPILREEQAEPMLGRLEIGEVGVQRRQQIVGGDALVEGGDEPVEERLTTDPKNKLGAVDSRVIGAQPRGESLG